MKVEIQEKREMRVRAAAGAALAVWCMSGPAVAAGYAEVWNPPEETGHITKQAGKKTGTATGAKSTAGSKGASKAAPKPMAGAGHAAPSVASAHGNKPSAHGSIRKVAASGVTKSKTQAAGANKTQRKAAGMTQSKKPHAQVVQAKPGQGKVVHANHLVQRRTAHPQAVKVTAKSDAAKPAASRVNVPAPSANPVASAKVDANPANASSNPATASSGSLPPIIH